MSDFNFMHGFILGIFIGFSILWVVVKIVGEKLRAINDELNAAKRAMQDD